MVGRPAVSTSSTTARCTIHCEKMGSPLKEGIRRCAPGGSAPYVAGRRLMFERCRRVLAAFRGNIYPGRVDYGTRGAYFDDGGTNPDDHGRLRRA